MKRLAAVSVLISAGILLCACGSNPVFPDEVQPSGHSSNPLAPPPPFDIRVTCPEFGEDLRCAAHILSDGREITSSATWTTSNSNIAIVNRLGAVTVLGTGEVVIRATYQGITGVHFAWAVAGNGIHGTARYLAGAVLSPNGFLPGVVMEILNGSNAGRTTTTSANGEFFMEDLQDGQFTIRLSKPGYVPAEFVWSIPGGSSRITTLSVAPG